MMARDRKEGQETAKETVTNSKNSNKQQETAKKQQGTTRIQ
jgi:hypothetical protein